MLFELAKCEAGAILDAVPIPAKRDEALLRDELSAFVNLSVLRPDEMSGDLLEPALAAFLSLRRAMRSRAACRGSSSSINPYEKSESL